MRLLEEYNFNFIQSLVEDTNQEIELKPLEYETDYTDILNALVEARLIEINSVRIDYVKGRFLDGFLSSYSKLIKSGKIEDAKDMAIKGNFSALNETFSEFKTIQEYRKIIGLFFKEHPGLNDGDFSRDLADSTFIKLTKTEELKRYFDKYLEEFKNDNLEKPEPIRRGFENKLDYSKDAYRYSKQRQIFIDLLAKNLETQNPKAVKVDYKKELPLEHINLTELLLCLVKEGVIKEYKFETDYSGNKSDKFDEFLGKEIIKLVVDENKIPKIPTVISKTINASLIKSTPFLLKEGKSGYLKFYKQGPKIRVGNLTSRKYKLMACLFDPLGVAKTTDAVFESIKTKKDGTDERLNNSYLAKDRKREIIQFTMKELQKIKKLKGKIKLNFQQNDRMIILELNS